MTTMIDIVGSAIFAGLIILLAMQLNASTANTSLQATLDVNTQENSTTIENMINSDFYKMGYHDSLNSGNPIVELADTSSIRFRADIDGNGSVDTVRYFTTATPFAVP